MKVFLTMKEAREFAANNRPGQPQPGTSEFEAQVDMICAQLRDVPMEHAELPRFLMLYIEDMTIHRGAITTAERRIEKARGWKRA